MIVTDQTETEFDAFDQHVTVTTTAYDIPFFNDDDEGDNAGDVLDYGQPNNDSDDENENDEDAEYELNLYLQL